MKQIILLSFLLVPATLFAQHTHRLVIENNVFIPEFLVVEAGDPIELQLVGGHTLTEVSSETFRAGGAVSNGGIHIGLGTSFDAGHTTFTIREPGEYYFVSEKGNSGSVKTRITVLTSSNTGVAPDPDQYRPVPYPNPADDQVRFAAHENVDMMSVQAFDHGGRLVLQAVVRGNSPLNVLSLPPGLYTFRLTDGMSTVYGVERLVISRNAGGL